MWYSILRYRFEDSLYSLMLIFISPHSPHGNAEVTKRLSCKPLKCQIPSKFWSQRFGRCWHLTRHFSICVIRRNLRTPGRKHFGAAVSLQLKNNPLRIGLGLHCFALLSLSIFAGTKAAGLAALVPREYCDFQPKLFCWLRSNRVASWLL